MKMKKVLAVMVNLTMVALLAGCGGNSSSSSTTAAAKSAASAVATETAAASLNETVAAAASTGTGKVKVAWICEGILTDNGWNADGYKEMQELATKYNLDVSYQENVGKTEAPDVIRNYASEGYKLVIDNEQYHCEIMAEIAPEFPDVTFACVNGYVSADNMIAITGDMWQHIYLAGVMAGKVTKSNKLGLITYSTDSSSALTMLAALKAGAQSVNSSADVIHVATGSFSDLEAGKEMCTSLIDQGCDVIFCNSGDCNVTVMQTCANKKVYSIGAIVDHNDISADYVLGSAMLPPSNILKIMISGYIDGTLKGSAKPIVMGIKEGCEEFRVNPTMKGKLDQSVFDALDKATKGVEDGSIKVELPKTSK